MTKYGLVLLACAVLVAGCAVNPVTGAKFLFGIMHKGDQKKSETKRWRQLSSRIRRMVG